MCAYFINNRKYSTFGDIGSDTHKLFISPFRNIKTDSIILIDSIMNSSMDPPMNTINTKVSMMQTQMAMMSLTVASMQAAIKQLEAEIERLKKGIVVREEPFSPCSVSNRLDIDDDDSSEGYDSDGHDQLHLQVETSQPKIALGATQFVMVPSDLEDEDSGYED